MVNFVKICIIQKGFSGKNRLNFGKYKGFGRLIKIEPNRFFIIREFLFYTVVF
jgi:hypothetical protein